MTRLRFLLPLFQAFFLLGLEIAEAEMKAGSSGILTTQSPLTMNGQTLHTLEAGQPVTILGEKAASQEAVVSVQLPSGEKVVGMLPQSVIVIVDAAPAAAAPASAPVAAAPTPTPAPIVAPDLTKVLSPLEIAEYFKKDRAAASALFAGKRVKVSGMMDRAQLETQSSGGDKIPVLLFKTAQGIPKVKVRLSPSVANGDTFFQKFKSSLPDWWWGYASRSIDFRMSGMDQIQARAVYDRSYRTTSSYGYSSTTRYKSNSDWFTIFAPGEHIEVEATFQGLYMDVEFSGGLVSSASTN